MKTLEVLEKVLKGKRVKPNTLRHYREALGSLARYSEEWPVSGVVINEWLNTLDSYADSTVKMWFDFVNSAGKYIKRAYKVDNPCEEADRPRVSKKRRRYFTPDEMMRVLGACRFGYDRELILTLVDSTCRIGELVGLRGRDVGEGFINVRGKTGERRYRLDIRVCGALRALAGSDDGLVFRSVSGEALNADSLTSRARRVIIRSGITGSKLGPHTLRHSGASLVAQETGSALAVKALLQHDNIDTSMEYIHDVEDVLQQRISPLKLIGEKVFGETKQVPMLTNGKGTVEVVPVAVGSSMADMAEDMFPDIEDGKEIRPLLKNEDLRLIREAFVVYCMYGDNKGNMFKARELMKRILRRPKVIAKRY